MFLIKLLLKIVKYVYNFFNFKRYFCNINYKQNIQQQYQGFIDTQALWDNTLIGLDQINLIICKKPFNKINMSKKLRLGHLVEQFVFHELNCNDNIEVLAENIQIIKDKITIGEIDCLLIKDNNPIHLEIIYKFYLYDESFGNTELEHWIGPNRKDSLIEKITKLKNKQLPLLYKNETKNILDAHHLNINSITQKVCFKAQLFVPYNMINIPLRLINNDCIVGFYIKFININNLKNHQFYIPSKIDWLSNVSNDVEWNNINNIVINIQQEIESKRAPLCWIKDVNNHIQKIFIVWWT